MPELVYINSVLITIRPPPIGTEARRTSFMIATRTFCATGQEPAPLGFHYRKQGRTLPRYCVQSPRLSEKFGDNFEKAMTMAIITKYSSNRC